MTRISMMIAVVLLLSSLPFGGYAAERDNRLVDGVSEDENEMIEICHAYHDVGEVIQPGEVDFYSETEDKPLAVMEPAYMECEEVPAGQFSEEDLLEPSD